jgi:hypothetical protein
MTATLMRVAHTGHCFEQVRRVHHLVKERPYPRIGWQEHAGDTVCGLVVDNGIRWSWCGADYRHSAKGSDVRCFFCFGGRQ